MLFILALLLAWPTFGLSLVAWVIYKAMSGSSKISNRHRNVEVIEPFFDGRFDHFFGALEVPTLSGNPVPAADAHQAGRLIMNYVAHNQDEFRTFLNGVKFWTVPWGNRPPSAIAAVHSENVMETVATVRAASYRGIETLMMSNPELRCFRDVDLAGVSRKRAVLERIAAAARVML
jgi:hypothetical protein